MDPIGNGIVLPLFDSIVHGVASSETLTVVCSEPRGYGFGFAESEVVQYADEMTGGGVVLVWDLDSKTATIVANGAGSPLKDEGTLIHASSEQVTFAVNYP